MTSSGNVQIMTALPEQFTNRMRAQLGGEFDSFIAAYGLAPVRGLRINTLKLTKERFLSLCPWRVSQSETLTEGLILEEDAEHIGTHPYHLAGLFYIQEPSAMSVIGYADIRPGQRVLDLCAAPGGKSGGVAARLCGSGLLVSNEIVPNRALQLARNLERLGAVNTVVLNEHPDAVRSAFPYFFDRVIVDAPCSGEGMFRKEPTAIGEWSPEHVISCAARQSAILESASGCVSVGGKLIYSTCTFSPEENEGVIDSFLRDHHEFKLETTIRLYPHKVRGEGHFCARLVRCGDDPRLLSDDHKGHKVSGAANRVPSKRAAGSSLSSIRRAAGAPQKAAQDFFRSAFGDEDLPAFTERLFACGDRLVYLPFEYPTSAERLRTVSVGTEVGAFDGKVFKPSHAFFMAAHGFHALRSIGFDPNDRKLLSFLGGNSIECELGSGYASVNVNDYPVGFGKVTDGILKNRLPKGLTVPFYR